MPQIDLNDYRVRTAEAAIRGEVSETNVSRITAFGIILVSQTSRAAEMSEMLRFAEMIARNQLAGYVEVVIYLDRVAYLRLVYPFPSEAQHHIRSIARDTLARFDMGNGVITGVRDDTPY